MSRNSLLETGAIRQEHTVRAVEILEKFSLYSEFEEGSMKSVRNVNHYIDREEQKTRKSSSITDIFKKTD